MATFDNATFTGTAGTTLDSYTGNSPQNNTFSPISGSAVGSGVLNGTGYVRAAAKDAAAAYVASGTPSSANYYVQADVKFFTAPVPAGFDFAWVLLQGTASADTSYKFGYFQGNWQIFRYVSGAVTFISNQVAVSPAAASTYTLKLLRSGSLLAGFVNGSLVCVATDTTITSAGFAGLEINTDSVTPSNSNGPQMTNFSAADLPATTATAAFRGTDLVSQGNWRGTYGADGHILADGTNPPEASTISSVPAYASVGTSAGISNFEWASSPARLSTPQLPSPSTSRIAALWDSSASYAIDLTITGSKSISLYCLDFDYSGRAQTVQVLDAGSWASLNSQQISSFGGGEYLSWQISGHVIFLVTCTGGPNSSANAIFFDSSWPASAPIVANHSTIKLTLAKPTGNWNTGSIVWDSTKPPLITSTDSLPAGGTTTRTISGRYQSAQVNGDGSLAVYFALAPYGASSGDSNWQYAPFLHSPATATVSMSAGAISDGTNSSASITAQAITNISTQGYPQAIANWASFPYQRQTGTFDIYVAADAMHGIASVSCTLTDSATSTQTLTQTQTTFVANSGSLGPAKGMEVYKFSFNATSFAAGAASLTFSVVPRIGGGGSILASSATINPSLSVYLDPSNALPPLYAAVSTGGNDGTGAASSSEAMARLSPFLTVLAARDALGTLRGSSSGDNTFIVFEAGTYQYNSGSSAADFFTTNVPVTLRAATGVTPSSVVLSNSVPDGLSTKLVKLQNLSLTPSAGQGGAIIDTKTIAGTRLFIDTVTMTGKGTTDPNEYFYGVGGGNWEQVFVRNSTRQQHRGGWSGESIVTGCETNGVSQNGSQNMFCMLDVFITDVDSTGTSNHSDVCIFSFSATNCLLQNVLATGNVTPQGLFFSGQTISGLSVRNFVFSGSSISNGFKFSASSAANLVSNLIVENFVAPTGLIIPSSDADQNISDYELMSFRNGYLGVCGDLVSFVTQNEVDRVAYLTSAGPGSNVVAVSDATTQFQSVSGENWRPKTGNTLPTVPTGARRARYDITGTLFVDNSPAGAFAAGGGGGSGGSDGLSGGVFHKRTKSQSLSDGVFRAR